LCGLFDGTVGPDAAEFCHTNIFQNFRLETVNFFTDVNVHEDCDESELNVRKEAVGKALKDCFMNTDAKLLNHCTTTGGLDYTSCTGVVALFWHHMLSIAHVGDSRACIAKISAESVASGRPMLECEWLTVDHKPDHPQELKRINEAGGSLVYLHGSKPFIRGADFVSRQALGQHPKQLNYSRAFGGLNLKPYGLSCEPTISHRKLTPEDKFILIASDGLWDTIPLRTVCDVAWRTHLDLKSNPARGAGVQVITNEIVAAALTRMPLTTIRDNVSVIAIFLDWDLERELGKNMSTPFGSSGIMAPPPAVAYPRTTVSGPPSRQSSGSSLYSPSNVSRQPTIPFVEEE
jgi:protein phosphatase